jgi:hypothetical protein
MVLWLESGDYSVLIHMNSNQKIIWNPSLTRVSTIAAGSSNVVLQDLYQ